MIVDMADLLVTLESYLKNYAGLSYVESTDISAFSLEALPDFENWAIVLSPHYIESKNRTVQRKMELDGIKITVICRNFDPKKSIVGKDENEKGIICMVADIHTALVDFGIAYKNDFTIFSDETDARVDFSFSPVPEKKSFFHIVQIFYAVNLAGKLRKI